MHQSQFVLLKDRRFWPLFITQFLGAFHDNLFKNAFLALLLYIIAIKLKMPEQDVTVLTTLAAGIFILPFVLFSALAGQYADKYPKEKVIQKVKLVEIGIAVVGALALITSSINLSFLALFLLGAQSAFFGPSKYSILPQHLKDDELIGGNALLSTGTFLAILVGTIIGSVCVLWTAGIYIVAVMMVAVAIGGYYMSLKIPEAKAGDPKLKISYNIFTQTWNILDQLLKGRRSVIESALGVAWFWFMGALFLSQLPNYTKYVVGASNEVFAFFIVLFSIGIAIGGLLNDKLLKGRTEALYVPAAVLGISVFAIDLFFAGAFHSGNRGDANLIGLMAFISSFGNWRIIIDLFLISICAGLFVVPLNAIIQHETQEKSRSRILAASAILNSAFVVSASVVCAILLKLGFSISAIFGLFGLANLVVALYICQLLPEYLLKTFMQVTLKFLYKVEIKGTENLKKAGKRAIIVSNHVSYLDAALLAAFLPGKPMFAVNSFVAEWFWVSPFLKLVQAFPLNPADPFSIKSLMREVAKDKHCVIFPEGRLTETGSLMKVYDGPGMIADKTESMILPIRLDGVQHTPFSRLKGRVPLRTFPKITITILEPQKLDLPKDIKGRKRRAAAGRKLYDIMEEMMFITKDREQTLYQALMKARHVNGNRAIIAEDVARKPMKFKKLVRGSLVLGKKLAAQTQKGEAVGLLMPTSCGGLVTFFALQAYARVPAMLNFSVGAKPILSACESARIKTVITSRNFVKMGRLEDLIEGMEEKVKIIYLEDILDNLEPMDKLYGFLCTRFARHIHNRQKADPHDPAVILFTSGSEGAPKGVVLSHANLMSNIVQLSSRVDFNRQDIVFNCLPMFHSFGLTGGTLLPVLSGVRTFLYPSPLHYRIVPELVYSSNATIMFGTDTFLNGYARKADPYDFYKMRYIFAGAERVKEETKELYANRFGVRILEGYGATETAPALALNSPMHMKDGSVGRLLSGIEYRLEDVPGVEEGGRLYVKGPNVMLGYYKEDNPGVLQPPEDGWYDTGDIVSFDEEGYIKILGRAKRFAKIAGEMVSLTSVEAMLTKIYPDQDHAVVAIPDARKGEQIILVTTCKKAKRPDISKYAGENGISELSVPKTILAIDKMLVLGSGKTDYKALQNYVEEQLVKKAA
ncbi:MAG: acyl-[ACP]--phospholipid O-acyltransferase [Alphaproteobacteria bacterium]|nr:acyl-[ACP]--phospholipid O-acyltransferase [Alphaproteobacteria bacterium]